MKPIRNLLVLLTMPLMMSCYSDVLTQQKPAESNNPSAKEAPRTYSIPYSATVFDGDNRNDGHATTRATLTAEKHYTFSTGDMLFVQGIGENADKIYGVLELASTDVGKSSDITFEGSLKVVEGFTPSSDTPLKATLVSDDGMSMFTFDKRVERILSMAYPKANAIAPTLAQAVERYSYMTAESTFGEKQYNLTQNSCFVNFTVTLADGTAAETDLNAYVWTDGDVTDYRNGQVTTIEEDNEVKAKFVVAFPGGTTLDGAVIGLDPRTPIGFGGTTTLVANKIYNVSKTFNKTMGSVSYPISAITKCNPDLDFGIELTKVGDGIVSYSSSEPNVATVNAAGEVTIVGAGETVISAIVADGVNYTYAGQNTASYTLTVKDPVALADVTTQQVGWVIGSDRRAYVTVTGVSASSSTPVAMIGYVGDAGSADTSSDTWHGLAVALSDANNSTAVSMEWADVSGIICTGTTYATTEFSTLKTVTNGVTNTTILVDNTCRDPEDEEDLHIHDAASASQHFSVTGFTPSDYGYSPWFLPSAGQWMKVLGACGVATSQWSTLGYCPDSDGKEYYTEGHNCAANYTAIETLMEAVGESFRENNYWTSTEASAYKVYYIGFNRTNGIQIYTSNKTKTHYVRPFFAF